MKLLLDTHTFLWFIGGDPKLSLVAQSAIKDPGNECYISAAAPWEIAIKTSLGKFTPVQPLDVLLPTQIAGNGFKVLPIQLSHALAVAKLPFHHRDPFDRMMIAQSLVEGMRMVSADSAFDPYGLHRLW